MRKIYPFLALFLSLLLILSGCKAVETSEAEDVSETTQGEQFRAVLSETTALPETTETTTEETTPGTTLPQAVSITTVPTPPVTPVTTPETTITQMTAPSVTTPITTSAPLVTTVPQATPAQAIQQKLTPITSGYSYNNLNADQKIVYNKILSSAKAHADIITFDNSPSIETVTNMYSLIYSEEINLQYLGESFKYDTNPVRRMQLTYKYSAETINSMDAETEAKANLIVSQITPNMTAFDIVQYFHDTIIKTCTYDLNEEFQTTAYGALVKGRATCQGYSHAMSLLCNKAGIENAFVTGNAGEPHMWNMIKLDGNWYHMDVTWDDPDRADLPDFVFYDYFNVTTAEMSSRQFYPSFTPLPTATAIDGNYYYHNGLVASSLEQAQQILFNQYISASNNRSRYVSIRCANAQVYNEVYTALITNQGIFSIQTLANAQAVNKFNAASMSMVKNETYFIIQIVFSY